MTFLEKALEMNFEGEKQDKEKILDIYCPCSFGLEDETDCESLDRVKCVECWNREMPNAEAKADEDEDKEWLDGYEKGKIDGLNDAWEFIKNLWSIVSDGVKMELFGTIFVTDILKNYTPQEAIAKMKAYEEAQIEVGDVVWVINEVQIVVTSISNNKIYGFDALGRISSGLLFSECKKTGKHIDIKSILEQIGE